jgi:hypothetical protein
MSQSAPLEETKPISSKPGGIGWLLDWVMIYWHRVVLALMLLALLVLSVVTCQIQQQLGQVEESITDRLRYRPPAIAGDTGLGENRETGEHRMIYVPATSHVYGGEGEPLLLTITLMLRNVDPVSHVHFYSARCFDTSGKLVKDFVSKPLTLRPLQTVEYLVPESDIRGGSGANFIVEWSGSDGDVNPPIVEALMIGSSGGQGISFVQRGSEINVAPREPASTAVSP